MRNLERIPAPLLRGSIDVGYNGNADLADGRMSHLRDRYYDFKKKPPTS